MWKTGFAVAIAALALVVVVSGCGGSKDAADGSDGIGSDSSGSAARSDAQLKFARCLRQHGVDVQEDRNHPGAIAIRGKPGDDRKLSDAQKACQKLVPGGFRQPSPEEQEKFRDAALKFARCMRAHGVDVPDPQTSGGGVRITVKADRDRPRFDAAQKACEKLMPGPPGGTQAAGR